MYTRRVADTQGVAVRKPVLAWRAGGRIEESVRVTSHGKPTTTSRGLGSARARRGAEGKGIMSCHIPLSEQVETAVQEVTGCYSVGCCK